MIVFIENAFKHSQKGQSSNILIDIEFNVSEEGKLTFVCKNNFHPNSNSTSDASKRIGLNNVKKRLQLLYPNAHQLNIRESEDKFEVYLSIQLEKAHQT